MDVKKINSRYENNKAEILPILHHHDSVSRPYRIIHPQKLQSLRNAPIITKWPYPAEKRLRKIYFLAKGDENALR
jgi:hypothetical protein